ncbi:hypothetical protein PVAP13_9NG021473 [Panicum virgatum]|uniref:Uncharacterized protein n=1 Tax=Panicum virgatum TaxID=38727 RepID=A0A8T0MD52_PANVG|nr:hypothetical protein PVAP13_9NG021473 [Panicum virgatum]
MELQKQWARGLTHRELGRWLGVSSAAPHSVQMPWYSVRLARHQMIRGRGRKQPTRTKISCYSFQPRQNSKPNRLEFTARTATSSTHFIFVVSLI